MLAPLKTQLAALGATALTVAVALLLRSQPGANGVADISWARDVEAGADHISTRELADRWLANPNDVLVVDVRPAADFAAFHLPQSHNLDLPTLLGDEGRALLGGFHGSLVVLVSEGMTHPAQAWVALAQRGRRDVRVLEDGLAGFKRDELTPPSLRGLTNEADAAAAMPRFIALRAAILGPQETPKSAPQAASQPTIQRYATDPEHLSAPTVVSADWVAKQGTSVVIVDTRDKAEDFAAGHIAGAVHAPISLVRGTRDGVADELLDPAALAQKVGALGIDVETEVVAYSTEKMQDATHFALALLSLGHKKVAILEGGLAAWMQGGRTLSKDAAVPKAKVYTPREAPDFAKASLDDVKTASTTGQALIIDSRPPDQFSGATVNEPRGGHIPGARNRPVAADVAKSGDGLFWRPKEQLRAGYEALGLTPEKPAIVSCRTGHQASETYFTLRFLLGHANVRWYDGSWKEWAAKPELPVATGADK